MTRFDPLRALRTFNRHEVRYILIGGYASAVLGAPIITNDVDICYDRTAENMNKLAGALQGLHATLRVAGADEELPLVLDGRTLAAGAPSRSSPTPVPSTSWAPPRAQVGSATWMPMPRPTTSARASSCGW